MSRKRFSRARRLLYCVAVSPLLAYSRYRDVRQLAKAYRSTVGHFVLMTDPANAAEAPELFARVDSALRLIAEVDPRRYRLVELLMPRFYVSPTLTAGQFWTRDRTCVLSRKKLTSTGRAESAATIIHELTHARLFRRGFEWWPDVRPRMELICIGEERRFVQLLGRAGWGVDARLRWYDQLVERLAGGSGVGLE